MLRNEEWRADWEGEACCREDILKVTLRMKIAVGPGFNVEGPDFNVDDEGEHCSTVVLVLLTRRRERCDAIVRESDYNIYIY
jgi:hypothetical protein